MSNTAIQLKKSGATGNTPSTLGYGEVALNYADGKLYYKNSSNTITYITNQQSFSTISANGSLVLATSGSDILTLTPNNGIYINADTTNKKVYFGVDEGKLSVYAYANAAYAYANTLSGSGGGGGVLNYFQNTAPATSNSHDFWTNSDTGVKYENFGNTTNPVWAEVGPTGTLTNTAPGIMSATQLLVGYNPTTTTGAGIQVTAANTKGGTGYADVLQVTNTSGGATNYNKYIRLDNTGTLQILNNTYACTAMSITDAGSLTVNSSIVIPGSATVVNGSSTDKYLNVGSHGQLFDDGNFHIHTSSGSLWLNSLDGGDIQLGMQTNSGTSKTVVKNLSMDAGYGSSAPVYGVRAWINTGWNGSSVTTRGSGNLSMARSAVGVYYFTFGTAMPDGNYAVNATAQTPGTNSDCAVNITYGTTPNTAGFSLTVARYGTGNEDTPILHVQVVR